MRIYVPTVSLNLRRSTARWFYRTGRYSQHVRRNDPASFWYCEKCQHRRSSRMTYSDAMKYYGNDKPDIRFEMKLNDFFFSYKGKNFKVFDDAAVVLAICAKDALNIRKQLDELTEFGKTSWQIATGLVYARYNTDGTIKSSVDKFLFYRWFEKWMEACNAAPGDLVLILAGEKPEQEKPWANSDWKWAIVLVCGTKWIPLCFGCQISRCLNGVKKIRIFTLACHAPSFHFSQARGIYISAHNWSRESEPMPTTWWSMEWRVGGGSIRIFNKELQQKCLKFWDLVPGEAQAQFGFLMNAFWIRSSTAWWNRAMDWIDSVPFRRSGQHRDFIAFLKITQEGTSW